MRNSSADRESQRISDLFHSFDFNGLQTVRAEIHIRISIYISSGIQIVYSLCTFYNCEAIAAMLAQFISRRQYQTADSGLGSGNNWPHSLSMITRRRRAIDAAFSSTGFFVVDFFFWFRFLIRRSLIVWVLDRGPGLVFWCCCYCCCCCCWTCQLFNKNCCYKKLSPNIKKST